MTSRRTVRKSPDGQYSVYVGDVDGRSQVIIAMPPSPIYGQQPDKPVARLTGIAYDPGGRPMAPGSHS